MRFRGYVCVFVDRWICMCVCRYVDMGGYLCVIRCDCFCLGALSSLFFSSLPNVLQTTPYHPSPTPIHNTPHSYPHTTPYTPILPYTPINPHTPLPILSYTPIYIHPHTLPHTPLSTYTIPPQQPGVHVPPSLRLRNRRGLVI